MIFSMLLNIALLYWAVTGEAGGLIIGYLVFCMIMFLCSDGLSSFVATIFLWGGIILCGAGYFFLSAF